MEHSQEVSAEMAGSFSCPLQEGAPDRTSAGCLVSSVSKSAGCSPPYALSLVSLRAPAFVRSWVDSGF